MAYHSTQEYAFNTNYVSQISELSKGIDKKLATFSTLGFFNEDVCHTSEPSPSEVFRGPRIYVEDIKENRDVCKHAHYFDQGSLRDYLRNQGVDSHDISCSTIFNDYRLREMMEHFKQLASLTVSYDDPDPTAFVTKMASKGEPDIELAKEKHVAYSAYDSAFKIEYISPKLVKRYPTASAPSLYHLYQAVVDAVEQLLSKGKGYVNEDFVYLEKACQQIELFTGNSVTCVNMVQELLDDYSRLNYIKGVTSTGAHGLHQFFNNIKSVKKKFKRRGSIKSDVGISLSPGGFLFSMFIGFTDYLTEMNVINMTTPLAGSSAGSLTAASVIMHGIDRQYIMRVTESLCLALLEGPVRGNLDKALMHYLQYIVPPDAYKTMHERIGKVRINFGAFKNNSFEPRYVTEPKSDTELLDALRSSCNVPGFFTVGAIDFRGESMYDGVFSTDRYFSGTTKVSGAHRTVRFMPMPVGYGRVVKTNLQNDVSNSFTQTNEKYFVHYLRLKSLQRELLLRRLEYDALGQLDKWRKELDLGIKVCHAASSSKDGFKQSGTIINEWVETISTQPGSSSDKVSKKDYKLAELFKLVLASELDLGVGHNSTLHAGGFRGKLAGVPIMRVFGDPLYGSKRKDLKFLSTPYTLVDWLMYERTVLDGPSSVKGASPVGHVDYEIKLLRDLGHHLTLPPSLTYYYTEFPYLLQSALYKTKNLIPAIYPQKPHNVRHMMDIGRTMGFRWVLGDYIAFENWIHLRVRQLTETPDSGKLSGKHDKDPNLVGTNDSHFLPIHAMQHKRLDETIQMMDQRQIEKLREEFQHRKGPSPPAKELFKLQNNLVRRAMVHDVVTSHFTHILGHVHFWIN
ncbi:patatin family protein, putative [Babesia ovis]|uniref:Patatin family protein, putative n=1 Tax=Babesia ovis TaxID=5869 RepID=A0A9W5WW81_BABOV|nr:patatin family protein, putative [Babesia ovis]